MTLNNIHVEDRTCKVTVRQVIRQAAENARTRREQAVAGRMARQARGRGE